MSIELCGSRQESHCMMQSQKVMMKDWKTVKYPFKLKVQCLMPLKGNDDLAARSFKNTGMSLTMVDGKQLISTPQKAQCTL